MARVAGGDAGELAMDARAGAARADPGRSLAAWPGPAPAGADCRRPCPARTEGLRSWPMTSWVRGGTSSAPEWQVADRRDGHVGPGGHRLGGARLHRVRR